MDAPVRNNPQEKEIANVVVPNGAVTAEVLLGPVQDGLGERHKSRAKANNGSRRPFGDVREVEIGNVQHRLNYIEQSYAENTVSTTKGLKCQVHSRTLRVCEPVTAFERRKAINLWWSSHQQREHGTLFARHLHSQSRPGLFRIRREQTVLNVNLRFDTEHKATKSNVSHPPVRQFSK
jgi:hypothetical protein